MKQFLSRFPKQYYFFNLIFMLERTAWFILIIQIPIFIAQKGVGGLEFTQETKGIVYLYWVLLQNSLPLILGNIIDKSNQKLKLILGSLLILTGSFFFFGMIQNMFGLLIGITLVSFGVSIFNPLMKGQISHYISKDYSSLGWGLHFWLYNLSIFIIAIPYSNFLRELGWEYLFMGSAGIYIVAILLSKLLKFREVETVEGIAIQDVVKGVIKVMQKNYTFIFLTSMAGFAVIYMQFYETLPNFIYDWSDTSNIVNTLSLPEFFLMDTWAGKGIAFEWLYNINTGLTLLFLLPFSLLLAYRNILKSLLAGFILLIVGFFISTLSMNGIYLVGGFIIYTMGELITNPKFTEYFDFISDEVDKSTYMGLLFFSNLIGYPIGALLGGYLYGKFGEKASLAKQYLIDNYGIDVNLNDAYQKLIEVSNSNEIETTTLLWETYSPFISLLPFVIIGVISLVGLLIYSSLIRNK